MNPTGAQVGTVNLDLPLCFQQTEFSCPFLSKTLPGLALGNNIPDQLLKKELRSEVHWA